MELRRLLDRLRTDYRFLPMVIPAVAAVVAVVLPGIGSDFPSVTNDAETARSILSTGAAATVTFGGLVFSITIVALQLTSSQFSPRALRQFLRDRASQMALGTFIGVFIYDLLVLARIDGDEDPFVPGLAVDVSVLGSAVAVVTFIAYVGHIAQSIRVVNIIEAIAEESRDVAARVPRADGSEPEAADVVASLHRLGVIHRPGPGAVMQDLNCRSLIERAERHDVVFVVTHQVGDFVPSGHPMVQVWGRPGTQFPLDWDDVRNLFGFGAERTMTSDLAFGFRQLADIAEKALSPALNDPTTAVQCIDRMQDLLRQEMERPPLRSVYRDTSGEIRLVHNVVTRDELIGLAFDEIRLYGGGALQVVRRVRSALEDLRSVAPASCRPVLDDQLARLHATVHRSFDLPEDRESASVADDQGLGDDA